MQAYSHSHSPCMYTSNTHTCIHTWWTIHGCTMPSDIQHLHLSCFELVVENRLFGTTHTNYMHESSIVLPHYTSSLCSSTYCRRYNTQFSNHAFTWLIKLAHISSGNLQNAHKGQDHKKHTSNNENSHYSCSHSNSHCNTCNEGCSSFWYLGYLTLSRNEHCIPKAEYTGYQEAADTDSILCAG